MKIHKNSRDSEDKSRIFRIYVIGFLEGKHRNSAGKKIESKIIEEINTVKTYPRVEEISKIKRVH